MAWNPNEHFTKEQFRLHAQYHARESIKGKHVPVIGGKKFVPLWWQHMEVRVFWETEIPMTAVRTIIDAIQERSTEIGLAPFSFKLFGNDPTSTKQVKDSLVNGQLDHEKLFRIAASESWRDESNGGRQHADIYITTKSFVNDTASWGAADFPFGVMMFTLHDKRYENLSFLRNVALHETNHLLGMKGHCNDYLNIDELPYDQTCNAHYSCSRPTLCNKCHFFLEHWWLQVEYEFNQLQFAK